MEIYAPRRDGLLRQLKDESLDAVLITNPLNVTYLTGFSGDSSYLIVTPSRNILVSDGRFTEQLREECPDLETVIRPPKESVIAATAAVIEKLALSTVGFESGHLTVDGLQHLCNQAKNVQWSPGPNRVEQLRQVKDADEIRQIRSAIHIAEKAFAMFKAMLRPEDTEKDLVDAMEMYVRKAGGTCTAFPTIVAVGERAALPHAPPTHRPIGEEILMLVDWGASGSFYKSDLTRVLLPHNNLALPGGLRFANKDKLREVYEVVLRAQAAGIAALWPGTKTGDVDAAARQVIADAGYGDYFTHSIGHGFGLQIHEAPMMRPGSEKILEAGMVVTVEPGVYLPNWGGIRIEDDVLVTEAGPEVLTSTVRDFAGNGINF
jgi:Xaa-Pro aminopeptidase